MNRTLIDALYNNFYTTLMVTMVVVGDMVVKMGGVMFWLMSRVFHLPDYARLYHGPTLTLFCAPSKQESVYIIIRA